LTPITDITAEMLERQLVCLQKRLLRRAWVCPVERRAAGHAAQCEDLHRLPLAIQVSIGSHVGDSRLTGPATAESGVTPSIVVVLEPGRKRSDRAPGSR
jgi:hypothetical protein